MTINRAGSLFSVFFTEGPVRDFAGARAADHERYARFFHHMLDRRRVPAALRLRAVDALDDARPRGGRTRASTGTDAAAAVPAPRRRRAVGREAVSYATAAAGGLSEVHLLDLGRQAEGADHALERVVRRRHLAADRAALPRA